MTAPKWSEVDEHDRDRVRRCIERERDEIAIGWAHHAFLSRAEVEAEQARLTPAYAAALARLAEPSAAERWRAVPEVAKADAHKIVEAEIAGCASANPGTCDECDALRALLALAREAERSGT